MDILLVSVCVCVYVHATVFVKVGLDCVLRPGSKHPLSRLTRHVLDEV